MSKSRARKFADIISGQENVPTTALGNVPPVTPTQVSDQANTSTGYLDLPSGTTAQRPSSATSGNTRFNTDLGSIEFYDGSIWIATNLIPEITSISGYIWQGGASDLVLNVVNATDSVDVDVYFGGSVVKTYQGLSVSSGTVTITTTSELYGQSGGSVFTLVLKNQDGTPSTAVTTTSKAYPSGGSISTYTSGGTTYRVHKFTSSGYFNINDFPVTNATILVQAGGGGTGASQYHSGGAGAGGCCLGSNISISGGNHQVIVGGGGAGAPSNTQGNSTDNGSVGGNSSFGTLATAFGGGAGGTYQNTPGDNGGCGGGGAANGNAASNVRGVATQTSPSGFTGYGNDGAYGNNNGGAGGGGGTGAGGGTPNGGTGGNGGNGIQSDITGTNTYYGGGGGGSSYSSSSKSSGGAGGGGNGSHDNTASNGSANTGGGAGAPERNGTLQAGKNGGSGVVIVRYAL